MNPDEVVKKYATDFLDQVFVSELGNEVVASTTDEKVLNDINQITVIIRETIAAVGQLPIKEIGIFGSEKGLLLRLFDQRMIGSSFKGDTEYSLVQERLEQINQELIRKPEKPEEKIVVEAVKVDTSILERVKNECLNYLGDFTEKIFSNQLKAQKINVNEPKIDDIKRLILGLSKAGSMIIGPKRAKEMTDKLLTLIKGS
ncbi:MAG: hypothetical protein ABIL05_01070 [candidate division WOR-3 bacterium]